MMDPGEYRSSTIADQKAEEELFILRANGTSLDSKPPTELAEQGIEFCRRRQNLPETTSTMVEVLSPIGDVSTESPDAPQQQSEAKPKKKHRKQAASVDGLTRQLHLPEQQTDNANATHFVDVEGLDIRFVPSWDKWLIWRGGQWIIDHRGKLATEKARRFAKALWPMLADLSDAPIESSEKAKAASFVQKSNDGPRITRMLNLASADPRVRIDHDELNSDPFLFNVNNGTIDLQTGRLREHQREDLITQKADITFDQDAICPQWEDALNLIFANDSEMVLYLQVLIGYSVSGVTDEHILPVCYGDGHNGKSTVWNPIMDILGDYGHVANESLLMATKHKGHPTEKAQLYQKRFVAISEPAQGSQLNESLVKELTGDSHVNARRMNEDFWNFKPTHTFWLSTNHQPRIRGTDCGIWRRIRLIPFEVDLRTVVEPDKTFIRRLVTEESSGILNWILEGAKRYRDEGLDAYEPEKVRAATAAYRKDEDNFGKFIDDCFEESEGAVTTAAEAFERYESWGGKMNKTNFGKEMKKRFDWDKPTGGPYRRKVIYFGFSLVE